MVILHPFAAEVSVPVNEQTEFEQRLKQQPVEFGMNRLTFKNFCYLYAKYVFGVEEYRKRTVQRNVKNVEEEMQKINATVLGGKEFLRILDTINI